MGWLGSSRKASPQDGNLPENGHQGATWFAGGSLRSTAGTHVATLRWQACLVMILDLWQEAGEQADQR
jgi:hypothetical protein